MFFVSLGKRAVGRPNQPTFLSLPQTSSLNRQIGSTIDIHSKYDGSPVIFFRYFFSPQEMTLQTTVRIVRPLDNNHSVTDLSNSIRFKFQNADDAVSEEGLIIVRQNRVPI